MENSSIIERIKKLLALSKSPNKAEAESALRFAQELMQKYDLEVSDVERGEITIEHARDYRGAIRDWDHKLLNVIARGHHCEAVRFDSKGSYSCMRLIGRPVNIEVARLMYVYVKKSALRQAQSVVRKKRDKFLHGFVLGIAYQVHTHQINWLPGERERLDNFITKTLGDAVETAQFDKGRVSQALLNGVASGSNLALNKQMPTTPVVALLGVG